jgi:putative hydrolase of the HAD superfamily
LVKKTVDFYEKICQILRITPPEIIHVGDHFEFDYLVPRAMGIRAFYLDRSSNHRGEFILKDLGELEKKLLSEAEEED